MTRLLDVLQLDRLDYDKASALQRRIVDGYAQALSDEGTLILLQHPPVLTIGRSGSAANILASPAELDRAGVKVIETNRGGDVTYHGPGQIVGYPILPLEFHGKDIHAYLRRLESVLIAMLREYRIQAERKTGFTGVWTPQGKIASIGVAISHWISYHGFALNVAPNLDHFKLIHPCGLKGIAITSMEKLLGRAPDRREVEERLIARFCEEFGFVARNPECAPAPAERGTEPDGAARNVEYRAANSAVHNLSAVVPESGTKAHPHSAIARKPFPPWIKKRIPVAGATDHVRELLGRLRLATVCQSAHCPNLCECFARGTATFMILGKTCTRSCAFCAVARRPSPARGMRPLALLPGLPPDPTEPERVAEAAAALALKYVVVTSVTRDDLADGGADHFRQTILALSSRLRCRIEVLTPDFQGDRAAIERVASARPDVYNHNVETVPRLYAQVRPDADYRRSLDLIRHVKDRFSAVRTKSGLMVGLGETAGEVAAVLRDLRAAGCDLVTIGQYLQPTPEHLPVREFVTPEQFALYEAQGRAMGFAGIASAPFVRSSYHAAAMYEGSAGPFPRSARPERDEEAQGRPEPLESLPDRTGGDETQPVPVPDAPDFPQK